MQKKGLFIYLCNSHLELKGGLVFCCFPCWLFFLLQPRPPRPLPRSATIYVIRHVIVFLLSRLIGFLGHRIFLLIKVAKIATNCKYTGLFKTPISSPFFSSSFCQSIPLFPLSWKSLSFFSVSLTTAAPCLSMPHLFTEPSTSWHQYARFLYSSPYIS